MSKSRVSISVLSFFLLLGGITAGQPKENISKQRHPNLAAAQRLSQQAWDKIVDAQKANEWDLAGQRRRPRTCLIR